MTGFDKVEAYFKGMFTAAFGVCPTGKFTEWQIEVVKKCASMLKEAEIDHAQFSDAEKQELKQQWKSWLETYTQGFKDELKRSGRLL